MKATEVKMKLVGSGEPRAKEMHMMSEISEEQAVLGVVEMACGLMEAERMEVVQTQARVMEIGMTAGAMKVGMLDAVVQEMTAALAPPI